MAMNFRFLTVQTVANQSGNENTHFWPTETGANKTPGSFYTWMVNVVEGQNGGGPETGGQERPESTCRNITQNFNSANLFGNH
jgi:hypothetical protein